MQPKPDQIRAAIQREVARWAGVTVDFIDAPPRIKLTFDGKTLRRPFNYTHRANGIVSYLNDARLIMNTLGAERESSVPSADEDLAQYLLHNPEPEKPVEPVRKEIAPIPDKKKAKAAPKVAEDDLLADFGREPGSLRIVADPDVERSGWGLYTNIPVDQYHLDPCPDISISNSLMGPMLKLTPANVWNQHPRNPEAIELIKATIAKTRGDIVHQLVLGKGKGIAVGDYDSWRTKDAQAFKADAEAEGLVPIRRADFEDAEILAGRILEIVKRTLDGASYETEVVFMYQEKTQYGPVWVRGMMDIWCEERLMILDPKVTSRLYDGTVERHAEDMGWDRQSVLYPRALGKINPEWAGRITFADLMVDPDPPYVHRFWRPDRSWDHSTHKQIDIAIDRFARCLKAGEWPGYGDDLHFGQLPKYVETRRTEMEIKG